MADAPNNSGTAPPPPETPKGAIYATYGVGLAGNGVAMMLKVIIPLWAIELQLSATQIGVAIGLSALLPFLLSIHGGILMDRLGTRRVTMAYGLTTAVLCPLYPLFPFFSVLVILQLITGLTSNMVWVGGQALIVRFTRGRTALIARFSVAGRCGTLAAPVAVGVVWDLAGPWGAFGFVGAAGLLVIVALLAVPETQESNAAPERPRLDDLMPKWRDYMTTFSLIAMSRRSPSSWR